MTKKNSNDQEYTWTVRDIRKLDERFNKMENKMDSNFLSFKQDIEDIKESIKTNRVVVDNTTKTDWKGIGIIVGATIAAILAAIQQVVK